MPAEWARRFHAVHGRKPRVLHVGNVANNGFNNARLLNEAGFDCDVVCYDHYHIMSSPEWEEAELLHTPRDHVRPRWTSCVAGYERPRWFAQGPLSLCADYLIARRQGRPDHAESLWRKLSRHNGTSDGLLAAAERLIFAVRRDVEKICTSEGLLHKVRTRLEWRRLPPSLAAAAGWIGLGLLAVPILMIRLLLGRLYRRPDEERWIAERTLQLLTLFRNTFPQRPDQLTADDVALYTWAVPDFRRLFGHYDVIQAYAVDPMFPLLAAKRPFVGYEHGTLRILTLSDDPLSRMTALAYNQADHSFITNGDCLEYAKKIGVRSFSAMLHPVDERMIRSTPSQGERVHRRYGARHVFLCTLRHDWQIKGTDKYIRSLPAIVREMGGDFVLLMMRWGAELLASEALARELGVSDKIRWIDPLPKRALVRMLKSVDVLFDQIALPHFGATAPEAIAAGVPVIMSYDPRATEWIIPEPAPILSAWTTDEIVVALWSALDVGWREAYRRRAAAWIDRWHNSAQVVERHNQAYETLLSRVGSVAPAEKDLQIHG